MQLIWALTVAACVASSHGFGNAPVPSRACREFNTGHGAPVDKSPRHLTLTYQKNGNDYSVTLARDSLGNNFRGYFIQAYDGNSFYGTMQCDRNSNCQTNCNGKAVQHVSSKSSFQNEPAEKDIVRATWSPPSSGVNRNTRFMALVVEDYGTVYQVESAVVV